MAAEFFSWGLAAFGLALPVSIAGASLVFFPLLAAWLLGGKWTWQRFPARWGLTEAAIGLFLLISFFSSILSQRPANSLHEMYKKDFYALVLVLTVAIARDEITLRRVVKCFLLTSLIAAALGLAQYLMGINQTDSHGLGQFLYLPPEYAHWPKPMLNLFGMVDGRAIGPRSHPLTFAEGLLFAWAYFVAMIPSDRDRRWWRWVLAAWLIEAGLLVSQSRAAWLAAIAIGIGGVLAAQNWKGAGRLLFLVLPCLIIFVVPSFQLRVRTIAQPYQRSNLERLHMWSAAKELWKLYPVLGIGPGNVKGAVAPYQNDEEKKEGQWGHLHSSYFNFLAERGAAGLIAFGLVILAMLRELLARFQSAPTQDRMIRLAAVLGILGFLISGATETTYNAGVILMSLYLTSGLGLAACRNAAERL